MGSDQANGDRLAIGALTYVAGDDGAGGAPHPVRRTTVDLADIAQASITAANFVA